MKLTKLEFFDVARILKPGLSWKQYSRMWKDFMKFKADHLRRKKLH